ncbi:MAG: signal peptidase II [Syntrophomonadaceae bacterium]|jgi:signal peptidase II
MQFWLSALIVVLLDRLSKWWVINEIAFGESRTLIDGFLYLTYIRNQGAAFGILQGKSWFFLITAAFIIFALIWYNHRYHTPRLIKLFTGCIAGGALGNLIDRVVFGYVVDFFDLGWWPVFNIADAAIVCGSILLVIKIVVDEKGDTLNA